MVSDISNARSVNMSLSYSLMKTATLSFTLEENAVLV